MNEFDKIFGYESEKQEMLRLCPNISEQIVSEDSEFCDDIYSRSPLRVRNRKKYINRYLQP